MSSSDHLGSASPRIIMVAEDEPLLRMFAVEFLSDEGFTVIEASHAQAALEVLQERFREIDLLFTDVQMPGRMNGLQLAHHVRHYWPNVALLIASGNVALKPEEMPAGSLFLPKPYNHRHVVHHIKTLTAA